MFPSYCGPVPSAPYTLFDILFTTHWPALRVATSQSCRPSGRLPAKSYCRLVDTAQSVWSSGMGRVPQTSREWGWGIGFARICQWTAVGSDKSVTVSKLSTLFLFFFNSLSEGIVSKSLVLPSPPAVQNFTLTVLNINHTVSSQHVHSGFSFDCIVKGSICSLICVFNKHVCGTVLDTWKAASLHSSSASPYYLTGIENMCSSPLSALRMNAGQGGECRKEAEIAPNNHTKLKMKLRCVTPWETVLWKLDQSRESRENFQPWSLGLEMKRQGIFELDQGRKVTGVNECLDRKNKRKEGNADNWWK